jgi:CDP-L-myo-inositol myo-inositolphosphotransferase
VVLAAGRSDRLRSVTGGGSKALIRVGGLAIVQRTVLTLLSYGLDRVVVVTGYHAGPVGAEVGRIAPGRVHAVYADGWEAGNGASLDAARDDVQGEGSFVLMTADHLLADGALRDLIHAPSPACLIDPAPDPETWAEGTKVHLAGDRIVSFGKELPDPAVDCGVFLLTPEVFACREEAAAAGDDTLAGAVTRLASRQPITPVRISPGCWWQDVDTPADLGIARRRLRRSLSKPNDGPVSRALNRPISSRISMALSPFRPSPDLVSLVATLIGVVAAVLLGLGYGIAGGIATQATSVIDGVDGELARLQLRSRPLGALLDGVLDRVVDSAVLAGLAVWAARESHPTGAVVALAVAATTGAMLSMATKDRITALGLSGAPERIIGYLLGGRDGRLLLVAILAVLGQPLVALAAVAITSIVGLVIRVVVVSLRMEDQGRIDARAAVERAVRHRAAARIGDDARAGVSRSVDAPSLAGDLPTPELPVELSRHRSPE